MSLRTELSPIGAIRITPDFDVGIRIDTGVIRRSLASRIGEAVAKALDDIVLTHFPDATAESMAGRGNLVQRRKHDGSEGDWHVTVDCKLLGVIRYPNFMTDFRSLEYAVHHADGREERRAVNLPTT